MKILILTLACISRIHGSDDLHLKHEDLKIENIDAFAFAGGGYKALVYEWAVLHSLAQANEKNLQEMLMDKSVGSNSGGSWFMNRLLYDRNVIESFDTSTAKKHVELMIKQVLEKFTSEVSKDPKRLLDLQTLCSYINVDKLAVVQGVVGGFCNKDTMSVLDHYLEEQNGWVSFTKDMHAHFKSDPTFTNVYWSHLSALQLEFQYDQKENLYYRSELAAGEDSWAALPVISTFNTDEHLRTTVNVSIPTLDAKKAVTLIEYEKWAYFWGLWNDREYSKQSVEVSKIKDSIENSISDPKTMSGPSAAGVAVLGSSKFFENVVAGLLPHWTRLFLPSGFFQHVENHLHTFVWKPETKFKNVPIGLADGGMHDNSGIIPAVKNLQDRGKNTGSILAITTTSMKFVDDLLVRVDDYELQWLFEEPNVGVPGYQVRGCAKPYAAIFKGSYDNSKIKYLKKGEIEIAVIEEVETIANPHYGIQANSVYKLIIIMPNCSSMKDESAVKLLPGAGTAEEFAQCAQDIEEDMKKLIPKLGQEFKLAQRAGVVKLHAFQEALHQEVEAAKGSNQGNASALLWSIPLACVTVFTLF